MRDSWFYAILLILVGLYTADSVLDLGWVPDPLQTPSVELRPTSFEEVKPIFEKRCVECHSAEHWNWTIYERAYERRQEIKSRVWVLRTMPAGRPMPYDERALVRDWVDGGGAK